jgi:hypothetical protein
LHKFNREEFIFNFYYIYLVTPKSKSKYIFFQIILAGITMKTNEFIRRATKADYDEIVSIIPSGEYDGDYLPDYFHILMDNPLYDPFVYILNDKIVCII